MNDQKSAFDRGCAVAQLSAARDLLLHASMTLQTMGALETVDDINAIMRHIREIRDDLRR